MTKYCFLALVSVVCVRGSAEVTVAQETVASAVSECSMEKELYFSGRSLYNLASLSASCFQKFGGEEDTRVYSTDDPPLSNAGGRDGSGFYLFTNNGTEATVEFHGRTYHSYGGIGNGFLLRLTQEGNDIYGQIVWHVGATGMQEYLDESWAFKAGTGAYDTNSLYSTYCSELAAVFNVYSGTYTVTFEGVDGLPISTIDVAAGSILSKDQFPQPPAVDGFVFKKWSVESVHVISDTVITAVYAKEYSVVFKDADGTLLDTQLVLDGNAATAPDMTGKTYNGKVFVGWSESFSSVVGDMEITAQYGEIPDFVTAAVESGLASGDDLIWSGSGTWDDTSFNWHKCTGEKTVWVDGADAVFPQDAQVAVSGAKACGNIVIGEIGSKVNVKFTGDAVSFVEGATVTLNGKVLEFGGSVSCPGAFSLLCNSVDESLVSYSNPLTFEDTLLFQGAKIADVSNLTIRMKGKFGGSRPVKDLTSEIDADGNGLHFYNVTDTQISAQAKVKTYGSYGGIWEVVKFVLTEKNDGIYGRVEYVCGGTGNGGWTAEADMDSFEPSQRPNSGESALVTAPEDDTEAWGTAPTYSGAIYGISYNDVNVVFAPPEFRVSGVLDSGSTLTIGENAILKTVGSGSLGVDGLFEEKMEGGGSLVLDSSASQKLTGKRDLAGYVSVGENAIDVMFNSEGCSWTDFRVYGSAIVDGYWTLPGNTGTTKVFPGGSLEMRSFYLQYGPQGHAPIYVYTNATMILTKDWCIGRSKPVHLIGGKVVEEGNRQQLIQKLYMADGSAYAGSTAYMGDRDSSAWAFIDVSGDVASRFSASSLILALNLPATAAKPLGAKFIVADVTGDEASDFILDSVISENSSGVLYEEGCRTSFGIWKTGAGTIELTAAGSCATSGVFKIDAGAVRLAASSSGAYGALILEGNAAIDCAGGSISFDDSAEFAWAEGAVLDITGDLRRKQIRFGTSQNGLTAAQLSSLAYNGKVGALLIDEDGYLVVKRGFNVRVR